MIYNENNEILKKIFVKEKISIPSKSTYHRLLINIDNNALEKVFRDFFFPFTTQENIAVDGKWLRGSDINGLYTQEKHKAILNIFSNEQQIFSFDALFTQSEILNTIDEQGNKYIAKLKDN